MCTDPGREDLIQGLTEVCKLPQCSQNGIKIKRVSGIFMAFRSFTTEYLVSLEDGLEPVDSKRRGHFHGRSVTRPQPG